MQVDKQIRRVPQVGLELAILTQFHNSIDDHSAGRGEGETKEAAHLANSGRETASRALVAYNLIASPDLTVGKVQVAKDELAAQKRPPPAPLLSKHNFCAFN